MSKTDNIIGELDPDQIACSECKEFYYKVHYIVKEVKTHLMISDACPACRLRMSELVRGRKVTNDKQSKRSYWGTRS